MRASQLASRREAASSWFASTITQEKSRGHNISEEAIGEILREEYARARNAYEASYTETVGEVDVDEMLRVEEEIHNEGGAAPRRDREEWGMEVEQ
ncbi:hypothetical protein MVES1_003750 [Malassezia vespertilionis]|uniref:Uncharacterized protein n=1 Tax=Malassezia vespertilionis TaxID=2020962 RepID=A0A2N1J8Y7_9BASI|nr:uncharacterized protein MVES1_003750 [Malassezia vespertilionis]PKI82942.1 hypothetical protein MVES_003308 [Malassezia vespertilionis]WFD08378.1 hypothetical protein MVES1_003750 [Malassezia vespertilionis]